MKRTILVLAANPKDMDRLQLGEEVRKIEEALQIAKNRDEFELKSVFAPRQEDVRRAMFDLKPNIVHFCGHGAGQDGIAFEDEGGNAMFVGSDALAGFFRLFAGTVKCIVLNACYSEVQAKVIAQHINYVIGMKKDIVDEAAIKFAVAFYDALGAGMDFDFAYKLACNAIEWANLSDDLIPKLLGNIVRDDTDWITNADKVIETIPHDNDHFGVFKEHVERVKQILNKFILPVLGKPLSELEKKILYSAVELHDIGLANPRTENNPGGPVERLSEIKNVREHHAKLSSDFVMEYYEQLNIPDLAMASIVARLCNRHRRVDYVRQYFKAKSESDMRVQLLASLLKLADALDSTKKTVEIINPGIYTRLPEEDKKRLDVCRLINSISPLHAEPAIRIFGLLPDDGYLEENKKKLLQRALEIFSDLFAVMPFTLEAGLPWCLVDIYDNRMEVDGPTLWKEWWKSVKATDIRYNDPNDIAEQLKVRTVPIMDREDTVTVLKKIREQTKCPLPPIEGRGSLPTITPIYPINSPQGSIGFIDTLGLAEKHIEIFGSDGYTYPQRVLDKLEMKLLSSPPVKVTLFLLSPEVLHELEGERTKLNLDGFRHKMDQARQKWKDWSLQLREERKHDQDWLDSLEKHFEIIFVNEIELAHLHGSLLVDDKILRVNIHVQGVPSSTGMIIHCAEPVNLLHMFRYQARLMRASGKQWIPWKE